MSQTSYPKDDPRYTQDDTTAAAARSAVFFPDSRASELCLDTTVEQLASANDLQTGIVELSTLAGVTLAATFLRLGIDYKILSFGQGTPEFGSEKPYDPSTLPSLEDAAYLFKHSSGTVVLDPENLHTIEANYVVIPAISGSGTKRIDLAVEKDPVDVGQTTLLGHLLSLFETSGQQHTVLMIDPPERGLVQERDGSYQRRVLSISFDDRQEDQ